MAMNSKDLNKKLKNCIEMLALAGHISIIIIVFADCIDRYKILGQMFFGGLVI